MRRPLHRAAALAAMAFGTASAWAQSTLPLIDIGDLRYQGAARVPAAEFNGSSMNFSEGPIAYNPDANSVFLVGHSHHQRIAEFSLPELVRSERLSDLNMAPAPRQGFSPVLGRMSGGNPQSLDRIGGLQLLPTADGHRLMVNAYEYYDAPGDNTHTSLQVVDPSRIDTSEILGPLAFSGGAGHTSGWMSPVPEAWQTALGGDFITGQSSGIPIIGRTSVGPSAFAFQSSSVNDSSVIIQTVRLLDFSLAHPLHEDLSNSGRDNPLWTHLSRAVFGMVVPGSRTYLTIGHSGGHRSGVCYKCTQDNGNRCGGYCPFVASDRSSYYWLWDLQDLQQVRSGAIQPHEVRPYAYGAWNLPFPGALIGGGSYDPASATLYVTAPGADREQGTYSNPPVIMAFSIAAPMHRDGFE